jgi:hypothetical protein
MDLMRFSGRGFVFSGCVPASAVACFCHCPHLSQNQSFIKVDPIYISTFSLSSMRIFMPGFSLPEGG